MQNYQELDINSIELDRNNPRIANYLKSFEEELITSDTLALLLRTNSDSCSSLRESIKENRGIIHPIIVNHTGDGRYIVIEGNTRLQIYREFNQKKVPGNWSRIKAVVHEELNEESIHAIRLQAHLVGTRDWDAFSKAKYLYYLSVECAMPMSMLVAYCGGSTQASKIRYDIQAYADMEEFYRPLCEDESQFDVNKFSGFREIQGRKDCLALHGYDMSDFAKWLMDDRIKPLNHVRRLPEILNNDHARKIFLKENSKAALRILAVEELAENKLKDVPYDVLAKEIIRKMDQLPASEIQLLSYDAEYFSKFNALIDANESIQMVIEMVDHMREGNE